MKKIEELEEFVKQTNLGGSQIILDKITEVKSAVRSWIETHYEIVCMITLALHEQTINQNLVKVLYDTQQREGICGMYDLAKEWTDEFEKMNEGRKWDGEFFEEVEAFAKKKIYGS